MQRIIFCLVLVAGNLLGICARSQFVPAGTPLNNLITERVYNLEPPALKSFSSDTNAKAVPLITASDASLEFDYMYSRQWYRFVTPGGGYVTPDIISKVNSYNVAPSLFFVVHSNLLVTAGFDYLHEQISEDGHDIQTFDDYTPFLCVDGELLHFLPHVDTTRNALFLGGNFAYTRAISSMNDPLAVGIGYNAYNFGPSLVYIRSLVEWKDGTPGRVSLTFNPAYNYDYSKSSFNLERISFVTVLGRVDYGITPNLYLNMAATWVHRDSIGFDGLHTDYAYFGGGLAAKLSNQSNHLVLFRLSYNYEAFLKQFEAHEVSAQVEFHF
jgi:hypothetical protein